MLRAERQDKLNKIKELEEKTQKYHAVCCKMMKKCMPGKTSRVARENFWSEFKTARKQYLASLKELNTLKKRKSVIEDEIRVLGAVVNEITRR